MSELERTCRACRHAHTEQREAIVDEGLGTQAEFDDVNLETWYYCRAPTKVGREVGTVGPVDCSLFAPGAKPDLADLDSKIAAAEARWSQKDAKDRERW